MKTGTVKWFNNAKGYGFILPEGGGEDLFVHYSSIQMEGYKTLKAGQAVHYDTQKGAKGYHAINVRAREQESAADPDAGLRTGRAGAGAVHAAGYAEDFSGD